MPVRQSKTNPPRRTAATAADVIGEKRKPVNRRVPAKWKQHHDRLRQLRELFVNRRGDLAKDAAEEQSAFSLHIADAATDSFDRDLALSRISSEQDALYEIDEALTRIEAGTYGICELTKKPIAPARLEAIPWTRFSVEAERELEREGSVRRSGVPPREPLAREDSNSSNPDISQRS